MPELTINPIQKKAIEFAAGVMQVLAGPGSGKTFIITKRIRYMIKHCKAEPSDILVITFTKAAAAEMQQRFYKLMEGNKPPVNFGTFHAIFYHILRQTGKYQKYTLITELEKRKLLLHILDMPVTTMLFNNEKIEAVLEHIGRLKNNGENIDALPDTAFDDNELTKDKLLHIYEEYNKYLHEFRKLDFDDMGLLCLKLFESNPEILAKWQNKYRFIMVDEFQDINALQYEIVKKIASPINNLFVVGDDDQSIYGFRGANPEIMQKFMTDYPKAKQLMLDTNYRCHEQIVEASLKLINENKQRFHKNIRAVHKDGGGVIINKFEKKEQEYDALIDSLRELDNKNTNTAAVIYRTNHECSELAERLLIEGIPFNMKEKLQCRYDHFVIKDILAYLEFAHGNRCREIFHMFMNRPLRYLRKDCAIKNPVEIDELLKYYKDEPGMQECVHKLFYDIERIRGMRPYAAVSYIRQVIGYDNYIKTNYGAETKEKLMEIAEDFQILAKRFKNFEEMNDYISQSRELIQKKREEIKKEDGNDGKTKICLMTMHASKGLEFDTVYLPDINSVKKPSGRLNGQEVTEEERRLLYVAMTRAKKELHMYYCGRG